MKLYANPDTYLTKKILVAASISGLEIEVPKGKGGAEEGRIPVLETDKGCIFSTNAIARYISRLRRDIGLYGQTLIESGAIDSWLDFCTHELEVPLGAWLQQGVPAAVLERAKGDVQKALTVLDNHLMHNTFMAGDQLTLADISLCCVLHHGMRQVLSTSFLSSFSNLRRWFSLCMGTAAFSKVLGKVETCADGAKAAPKSPKGSPKGSPKAAPAAKKEAAPKKEAAAKKEAAPKKEAKKEAAEKKEAAPKKEGKKDKKAEEKKEEPPKEPTPEELEKMKKDKLKKVVKEGGKRGVEIEGAADMGGLQFFCTSVDLPEGDLDLSLKCVEAMNAKSDPSEEERKGGSGHIGKMVFSAGVDQLAIVAYVPEDKIKELSCEEWLKTVLGNFSGEVCSATPSYCTGIVKTNSDKGVFPLKIREPMILEANNFLRKKGLFPEDNGSDDDECVFGDDDFPS